MIGLRDGLGTEWERGRCQEWLQCSLALKIEGFANYCTNERYQIWCRVPVHWGGMWSNAQRRVSLRQEKTQGLSLGKKGNKCSSMKVAGSPGETGSVHVICPCVLVDFVPGGLKGMNKSHPFLSSWKPLFVFKVEIRELASNCHPASAGSPEPRIRSSSTWLATKGEG